MSSLIVPPSLQPGDTIGLICPAGKMDFERTVTCIDTLAEWGYDIRIGKTVGSSNHYFSGTDKDRLQDLQLMLDDHEVQAILCARGGYGTSRIIDQVNWSRFQEQPKWIIGYSDVTVLHSTLYTKLQTASLHAPMAGAFLEGGADGPYVQSLRQVLQGLPMQYDADGHAANRTGSGTGPLLGGNLSLLAHQIGTPTDINTSGALLFIEDVGEYLYNVDRMLLQLHRAGKLSELAGLIIGGFSDLKDTTTPMGMTLQEMVMEKVAGYGYPVCFGFPVSHEPENYALQVGVIHSLEVSDKGVLLSDHPL